MANPTCDQTTLVDDATCYSSTNISDETQWALLVYAKVLELAAIGGTDYSAVLTSTLLSDSNEVVGSLLSDQIMAAQVARAFANAEEAGATVPSTINDKLDEMRCLTSVPGGILALQRLDLWLTCLLGRHEAYPQT